MKNNLIIILVFFLIVSGCGKNQTKNQTDAVKNGNPDDPIGNLVLKINTEKFPLWNNGIFPRIDLPSDAKPEDVIKQAVEKCGFNEGHIKTYRIREIRSVRLGESDYSAALLETDLGNKILLFRYENDLWWTQFNDVNNEKTK